MERTKAGFKAARELVGVSQQLLARELGVTERSARRWEKTHRDGGYEPPEDAWLLLERMLDAQEAVVSHALDVYDELADDLGDAPIVDLTYWEGPEQYEAAHPGEGAYWQMANANSRMVASVLMAEGAEVRFGFAGQLAPADGSAGSDPS